MRAFTSGAVLNTQAAYTAAVLARDARTLKLEADAAQAGKAYTLAWSDKTTSATALRGLLDSWKEAERVYRALFD